MDSCCWFHICHYDIPQNIVLGPEWTLSNCIYSWRSQSPVSPKSTVPKAFPHSILFPERWPLNCLSKKAGVFSCSSLHLKTHLQMVPSHSHRTFRKGTFPHLFSSSRTLDQLCSSITPSLFGKTCNRCHNSDCLQLVTPLNEYTAVLCLACPCLLSPSPPLVAFAVTSYTFLSTLGLPFFHTPQHPGHFYTEMSHFLSPTLCAHL